MKTIYAPISSKGQVVIPKTIRDLLKVNEGDNLEFVMDDNKIYIQKGKAIEPSHNLIEFLIKSGSKIFVSGGCGVGKTYLISQIIKDRFSTSKIGVAEPFAEMSNLLKREQVNVQEVKKEQLNFDFLIESEIDILIIDEAHLTEIPKKFKELNIPIISISQVLLQNTGYVPDVHVEVERILSQRGIVNNIFQLKIKDEHIFKEAIYCNN